MVWRTVRWHEGQRPNIILFQFFINCCVTGSFVTGIFGDRVCCLAGNCLSKLLFDRFVLSAGLPSLVGSGCGKCYTGAIKSVSMSTKN